MALRTFVKVSGVNNLSDARYCAGMGVDLIGFNLDPAYQESISIDKFKEITEWILGVGFVGEITTGDYETLKNHLDEYDINLLQIEDPEKVKELKLLEFPLILKLDTANYKTISEVEKLMQEYHNDIEFFAIESSIDVDKNKLNELTELGKKYPIVLGYGITENNVNDILETTEIKGISLKGGNEIRPGYKDFDDLAKILELIEVDDIEE
jgi:phosphoribosylanthranilate isomerase